MVLYFPASCFFPRVASIVAYNLSACCNILKLSVEIVLSIKIAVLSDANFLLRRLKKLANWSALYVAVIFVMYDDMKFPADSVLCGILLCMSDLLGT